MTRLEKIFKQTIAKKKILVTYTVAGDPSLKTSKKILDDLVSSGADILEIGVPFSDPMSEGPVIQKAHERALKKNIEFKINNTEKKILENMINSPGKTFSRDDIGSLIDLDKERSIDVIITRLRKKIEIDPKNPKFLQTIRGAGYVLWIE